MTNDSIYQFLKWLAIAIGVVVLGMEAYRHFAGFGPGDIAYVDANSSFEGGAYEKAAQLYRQALEEKPDHAPAMRGLANTYVQLKDYETALRLINRVIELEPKFGGNYAIRGIIYDHLGEYQKAMADYEKAIKMDPKVTEGMHWLDRLLYNVQETPPTVLDRLKYLKAQMALPPEKRVLRMPEIDAQQRPYEQ